MEINQIFGYLGALMVGLFLGLTGGGGSIITVPVLVYLFGLNPVTATAYSLFVVGSTSSFGAFQNFRNNLVEIRTAIIFAIPAFILVYITRRLIVPAISETVLEVNDFILTKNVFIMSVFAFAMIFSSYSMIKSKKKVEDVDESKKISIVSLLLIGVGVGLLTGFIGAGGGFLIIPALVLIAKLPMKKAVGTSLLIISVNSLIGFIGDLQQREIDWSFLLTFTAISIIGIIIGVSLSKYISGKSLKKGFGWFTLIVAFYIIYRELF